MYSLKGYSSRKQKKTKPTYQVSLRNYKTTTTTTTTLTTTRSCTHRHRHRQKVKNKKILNKPPRSNNNNNIYHYYHFNKATSNIQFTILKFIIYKKTKRKLLAEKATTTTKNISKKGIGIFTSFPFQLFLFL